MLMIFFCLPHDFLVFSVMLINRKLCRGFRVTERHGTGVGKIDISELFFRSFLREDSGCSSTGMFRKCEP